MQPVRLDSGFEVRSFGGSTIGQPANQSRSPFGLQPLPSVAAESGEVINTFNELARKWLKSKESMFSFWSAS